MPLATCPECLRHIKLDESHCPFCQVALPADLSHRVQNRPVNPRRFGRAALVSFTAALAGTATACGSDDDGNDDLGQKQGQGGDGAGGTAAAGGSTAATGGTVQNAGGAMVGAGGEVGQPVYGIPVDPPIEPMPQPEYGVAIDWDAEAPDANQPVPTDAGVNTDASSDASDGSPVDGSGGAVNLPVYGIPIDQEK